MLKCLLLSSSVVAMEIVFFVNSQFSAKARKISNTSCNILLQLLPNSQLVRTGMNLTWNYSHFLMKSMITKFSLAIFFIEMLFVLLFIYCNDTEVYLETFMSIWSTVLRYFEFDIGKIFVFTSDCYTGMSLIFFL